MNTREQYHEETGLSHYDTSKIGYAWSDGYIEWLEKQVEKLNQGEILPLSSVNKCYTNEFEAPFRVGRKQKRAVLDAKGREVIVFPNSDQQAQNYCDYLNDY